MRGVKELKKTGRVAASQRTHSWGQDPAGPLLLASEALEGNWI